MVFTRTQIIYRRCDAVEVGLRPPLGGYTGPHSGWGKRVVVFIAGRAIDPSSGGRPVSPPHRRGTALDAHIHPADRERHVFRQGKWCNVEGSDGTAGWRSRAWSGAVGLRGTELSGTGAVGWVRVRWCFVLKHKLPSVSSERVNPALSQADMAPGSFTLRSCGNGRGAEPEAEALMRRAHCADPGPLRRWRAIMLTRPTAIIFHGV